MLLSQPQLMEHRVGQSRVVIGSMQSTEFIFVLFLAIWELESEIGFWRKEKQQK